MPVYKDTATKTYYFITRIKQNDGTVKQVKRRGFRTQKEAKLAEAQALIDQQDTNTLRFSQVANSYLEWYEKRRKQSSINVIKNIINNHLIIEFGDVKLEQITAKNVMLYQNKIIDAYSPDFLKKIHTTLSAIFNFAIKFHGFSGNPAQTAGNFEVEKIKRINFWEYEEFTQFIEHVDDLLYRAFFTTLYYSGARKGELLAITWEDVIFEDKTIRINKTNYNNQITAPKTKASIRDIMLPSFVMDLLLELKNAAEYMKSDYVVFGQFYDSISTTTLDRRYAKYIKASGVKRIILHEFRHSHASYLINKGVSPLVVSQRLGHSDVATTLNTYSHLYPSKQSEVVEMMEKDIKKAQSS